MTSLFPSFIAVLRVCAEDFLRQSGEKSSKGRNPLQFAFTHRSRGGAAGIALVMHSRIPQQGRRSRNVRNS